jgi:hypothetical protein
MLGDRGHLRTTRLLPFAAAADVDRQRIEYVLAVDDL